MSFVIIPAQPGWAVLYPSLYADGDPFHPSDLEPIIAWRVETEKTRKGDLFSSATPITADMEADDYMVVRPDGVVIQQDLQTFKNVQQAIEWVRSLEAKK